MILSARTRSALVLALASVALTAGCSTADTPPKPFPLPTIGSPANPVVFQSADTTVLADGSMVLPLDAYNPFATPADKDAIFQAVTVLERKCMHDRGAELPAGWAAADLPQTLPPIAVVGVTTEQNAKTFGYRLPDDPAAQKTAALPADPAEAKKVLDASTPCLQVAFTKLHYQKASAAYGHVMDLWDDTLLHIHDDPRMKPVDAAWSACMKTAGYVYPSPMAAAQDKSLLGRGLPVPAGARLAPPSPIEKTVALADVKCKQQVDYLRNFATVASAMEKRMIAADGPGLEQVLAEWQDVLQQVRSQTA